MECLGFDADPSSKSSAALKTEGAVDSDETLATLSRVLRSDHGCDMCDRSFVDEAGLKMHKERLHLATKVVDYLKYANATTKYHH